MADNTTLNTMTGGDVIASDDVAGVKYQRVKLVDGTADSTAAIAGDATNGLDVDITRIMDRAANGNAGSVATVFTMTDLQGMGTAVIQATAWGSATVLIEGSGDAGTTWTALNLVALTTGAITTSITAAGIWQVDIAGLTQLRARCSVFASGTNTVNARLSNACSLVSLDNPLPAGTNIIGALVANQSVNVAQINGVAPTMGNGGSGTGVQRVTLASDSTGQVALAAGAATIGSLAANQSVNNAQINGVAPSMGNGASGTGVQRVTLANDSTGILAAVTNVATIGTSVTPGTAAANLGKAEDAGHTTGDVGVMALGVRRSDANSLTAVATSDDDYIPLTTDTRGVLQVVPRPRAVNTRVASAGLTIVTTAYSIGDQLGTMYSFTGAAVATGGTGIIQSITVVDEGDVCTDLRLWFFRSNVTLATNNAAFAISDADMRDCLGFLNVPPLLDMGANRIASIDNIGKGYDTGAGTTLYVAAETRTANAVFTAVTDLSLRMHLLLD